MNKLYLRLLIVAGMATLAGCSTTTTERTENTRRVISETPVIGQPVAPPRSTTR